MSDAALSVAWDHLLIGDAFFKINQKKALVRCQIHRPALGGYFSLALQRGMVVDVDLAQQLAIRTILLSDLDAEASIPP